MRVIGGTLKGRRLASFRGLGVRPTPDPVREALFNILQGEPAAGGRVLDLFAGTGALGIEALSRGAAKAVFVDSSRASVSIIRKNIEICGLAARSRVINRDALAALRGLAASGECFDLIFMDPPYESGYVEKALGAIEAGGLLNPGGMVVAEASARSGVDCEGLGLLGLKGTRRYGDTKVYFFTTRTPGEAPEGRGGRGRP